MKDGDAKLTVIDGRVSESEFVADIENSRKGVCGPKQNEEKGPNEDGSGWKCAGGIASLIAELKLLGGEYELYASQHGNWGKYGNICPSGTDANGHGKGELGEE